MAEIIRMPRLSDTMEEGNIVGWMKNEGDTVEPGDVLAEVETDKATMELESFHNGTLLYIGVKEGPVPVDGIIAIIGNKGEDYKELLKKAESENAVPEEKKEEKVLEVVKETVKEGPKPVTTPAAPPKKIVPAPASPVTISSNGRVKASPLARKMANDSGVALNRIKGTGENGRIIKKDVEAYLANPTSSGGMSSMALQNLPEVEYGSHRVSQMRKTIARRLGESKFSAPHFYLTVEINMDSAIQARKAINEMNDFRVSFNDLVVKAAAIALKFHPNVNSSWMEDHIEVHEHVNIGVAVAVSDGLLVPVINNADQISLRSINEQVKALAGKAKDKKLQPDEMQGNTFTISNLGMLGIEEFTAIINPPDACILAVGAIIQKPIVKDGQITVGNMMKVTLSCDHRVVDGATGAEFLGTFKKNLENPYRFLI